MLVIFGPFMVIKNSAQIDMSVERGQKSTPDKVSESGNFSTFENSQVWCNLPANYLPLQSPIQQEVHETKNLFDLAFQKLAWEILSLS